MSTARFKTAVSASAWASVKPAAVKLLTLSWVSSELITSIPFPGRSPSGHAGGNAAYTARSNAPDRASARGSAKGRNWLRITPATCFAGSIQ